MPNPIAKCRCSENECTNIRGAKIHLNQKDDAQHKPKFRDNAKKSALIVFLQNEVFAGHRKVKPESRKK